MCAGGKLTGWSAPWAQGIATRCVRQAPAQIWFKCQGKAVFSPHLAEHDKWRLGLQLPHMLRPIVITVKRRIHPQIDILRRVQSLLLLIRNAAPITVVATPDVIVRGHAAGSVSIGLEQDVVQAQVRIEHKVLETVELQHVAM